MTTGFRRSVWVVHIVLPVLSGGSELALPSGDFTTIFSVARIDCVTGLPRSACGRLGAEEDCLPAQSLE